MAVSLRSMLARQVRTVKTAAGMHPTTNATLQALARNDAHRVAHEQAEKLDPKNSPAVNEGVNLEAVGEGDAGTIESAEHKALGYLPPKGSLAARAQAAAAHHPRASVGLSPAELREAARADAEKVRTMVTRAGARFGAADAATIESAEHKALGYRPPPDSLAARAKAEAAEHPGASAGVPRRELQEDARSDAMRIRAERDGDVDPGRTRGIELESVGQADAETLESAEHKALGYRPPPGSLAARANAAATKHPDTSAGLSPEGLVAAAREDARTVRGQSPHVFTALETEIAGTPSMGMGAERGGLERGARTLQSEEHRALGYRPPKGSLAAEAQAAAARMPLASVGAQSEGELRQAAREDAEKVRAGRVEVDVDLDVEGGVEGVTEEDARAIQSAEHKA